MKTDDMKVVGLHSDTYNRLLGLSLPVSNIYQSPGLFKHIAKRHPDCLKYYSNIPDILASPDYIGCDRKKADSIEFVKKLDEYLLVAVTLDVHGNYLYVSSMYDQTLDKVQRRIHSGRYIKV